MPQEFSRAQRVSGAIQKELATILYHQVKDQRLKLMTISAVKVTRDLAYAKVYVTVLDDKQAEDIVAAANKAAGFIRTLLAKKIDFRTVPSLTFIYDKSLKEGQRMAELIDKAIARDKKTDE